ncbi:hypothetical protein MBRA1_001814 [Malassezia brasiliensis]|uniref:Cation/H+ exchanger transmembrane domain-containing protein n=1 Tax=Malassezia brasiliensis TaxID=1821822 RepID=A0AAF0DTI8_9BASI|nr:hypothetical protein MBRA1_001814 [Malassezia brasiliensis]
MVDEEARRAALRLAALQSRKSGASAKKATPAKDAPGGAAAACADEPPTPSPTSPPLVDRDPPARTPTAPRRNAPRSGYRDVDMPDTGAVDLLAYMDYDQPTTSTAPDAHRARPRISYADEFSTHPIAPSGEVGLAPWLDLPLDAAVSTPPVHTTPKSFPRRQVAASNGPKQDPHAVARSITQNTFSNFVNRPLRGPFIIEWSDDEDEDEDVRRNEECINAFAMRDSLGDHARSVLVSSAVLSEKEREIRRMLARIQELEQLPIILSRELLTDAKKSAHWLDRTTDLVMSLTTFRNPREADRYRGRAVTQKIQTWAWEICLGTFLGALMGFLARRLIRFSERKKLVDRESFVAQYVSLALASMGVNVLLGSDDLLAAFACGSAFAWDGWFQKQTEDSNFSSIIDLLFNIGTFVYIGAIMPWHDFVNSDINLSIWRLIVLAILILLLKRIPVVVALWKFIPDIKTFHEAVFSGYFGPMGVGAIFMSTYGRLLLIQHVEYPPQTTNDVLAYTIQPIVFFLVLASVVVHGFTVPFFAFGKRAHVNLSRTLSMAPSYAFSIDEPGWVTSLRRTMTGATGHAPPEEEPTGQTSVVEAMHQGLRRLREPSVSTDEESLHGAIPDTSSLRKNEDEDLDAEDDQAEPANVPANDDEDWGGEDTAEMRKYRRKRAMERRAAKKEHGGENEKDIADMAYDDMDDNKYPRVKQWLEGHSMVLEYQEHPLSEAKTVVIPISDDDYHALYKQNKPFHVWLARHSDKLENYFGWDEEHPLAESHLSQLFRKGIPGQISKHMTDWLGAKKSDPSEIQSQPEFSKYTRDQRLGKSSQMHSNPIPKITTDGTNGTDSTVGNNAPGTIISVPPPNTWRPATYTYPSVETERPAPSDEPYDSGILRSHDTSNPEERKKGVEFEAESEAADSNVPRVSFAAYRPPGVTEKAEAEAEANASS